MSNLGFHSHCSQEHVVFPLCSFQDHFMQLLGHRLVLAQQPVDLSTVCPSSQRAYGSNKRSWQMTERDGVTRRNSKVSIFQTQKANVASAGYQWCSTTSRCFRDFEETCPKSRQQSSPQTSDSKTEELPFGLSPLFFACTLGLLAGALTAACCILSRRYCFRRKRVQTDESIFLDNYIVEIDA